MTKEKRMIQCIRRVLETQKLDEERESLRHMLAELNVELFECAAALLYLRQTQNESQPAFEKTNSVLPAIQPIVDSPKMVRYRLAVGQVHGVSKEAIQDVLVEESGVDRKLILSVDIRNDFTIVELPAGMPEDIFQHLKSIEIKGQRLDIKRLKNNSNKRKANNARRRKKRSIRAENQVMQEMERKKIAG